MYSRQRKYVYFQEHKTKGILTFGFIKTKIVRRGRLQKCDVISEEFNFEIMMKKRTL